jgi:hypothetical protein
MAKKNPEFDIAGILQASAEQNIPEPVDDSSIYPDTVGHYVSFPQGMSKVPVWARGQKIMVCVRGASDVEEDMHFFVDELKMLMVDVHATQVGRHTAEPRKMWPHTETGQRDLDTNDGPWCRSANGIVPAPRYLGKEFYDHRTGDKHRIGLRSDGSPYMTVDTPAVCPVCPFGQWQGRTAPLCRPSYTAIVYIPPQEAVDEEKNEVMLCDYHRDTGAPIGILARVTGFNLSVDLALRGRKEGASGCRNDGSALAGLGYWFRETKGKAELLFVPFDEAEEFIVGNRERLVLGVTVDKGMEDIVRLNMPEAPGIIEKGKGGYVLALPSYPFAPNGKPEERGSMADVYWAVASITQNAFKNPAFIPEFALSDETITPEEYGMFLQAKMYYWQEDIRTTMLALEAHTHDGLLALSDGAMEDVPELPSGGDSPEKDVDDFN